MCIRDSRRRARLPQGLPGGHRFVQRVLRERPSHGDGAGGVLQGAGRHEGLRRRVGVRLLRALHVRGCRRAVRHDGGVGEGRDARGGPPRLGGCRGGGARTGGGAGRERRGAKELTVRARCERGGVETSQADKHSGLFFLSESRHPKSFATFISSSLLERDDRSQNDTRRPVSTWGAPRASAARRRRSASS